MMLTRLIPLWLLLSLLLVACGGGTTTTESTPEVATGATAEVEPTEAVEPTEPPAPEATATAEPAAAIEISKQNFYYTSVGALYVVGEAINTGNVPAEVRISVTLEDSSGAEVASSSVNLGDMPAAVPGQPYPFRVLFNDIAEGSWETITIESTGEPIDLDFTSVYLDVALTDVTSGTSDAGHWLVTGNVVNTGPTSAKYLRVVALAYDAEGNVIEVLDGFAEPDGESLAPGASAPFTIESGEGEEPASYTILTQAMKVQE